MSDNTGLVEPLFDPVVFGESVRWVMGAKGLSFRQAAPLVGVSSATLCRVANGSPPDVESYLRIRAWLGMDTASPPTGTDRARDEQLKSSEARALTAEQERDEADKLLVAVYEQVGEGIHTAFRKGVDGKGSAAVWRAISDMTDNGYGDALDWFRECIGLSDYMRARKARSLLSSPLVVGGDQ